MAVWKLLKVLIERCDKGVKQRTNTAGCLLLAVYGIILNILIIVLKFGKASNIFNLS